MGIPLLGICRGIQEMNVAFGGTLHPEISQLPGRINHRAPRLEDGSIHPDPDIVLLKSADKSGDRVHGTNTLNEWSENVPALLDLFGAAFGCPGLGGALGSECLRGRD